MGAVVGNRQLLRLPMGCSSASTLPQRVTDFSEAAIQSDLLSHEALGDDPEGLGSGRGGDASALGVRPAKAAWVPQQEN